MTKLRIIKPEEYTMNMGPAAAITQSDAELLRRLHATREHRIREVERWLAQDAQNGFIAEEVTGGDK